MKPYIQYKLIIIPNSISCFHRALLTRVLRKLRLSHRHLLIKGIFYMISLKPPLKKNTRDGELFGMRKVIDGSIISLLLLMTLKTLLQTIYMRYRCKPLAGIYDWKKFD